MAYGHGPDGHQTVLSLLTTLESANALLDHRFNFNDHPRLQSSNSLSAVAASKINPAGKVLSVPWVSDVRILFYRKDILAQAGISSPPKTWSEFYKDATKLATRGSGQYGLYIPQWESALPVELQWQAGGSLHAKPGLTPFNTQAVKRAGDFYTRFYKTKLATTTSHF